MLPTVRAMLVMLQGIWFIQIAEILYTGEAVNDLPHGLFALVPLHPEILWEYLTAVSCEWQLPMMAAAQRELD